MYLRRHLIGLCEYSAFNVICQGNKSKENRANPANQWLLVGSLYRKPVSWEFSAGLLSKLHWNGPGTKGKRSIQSQSSMNFSCHLESHKKRKKKTKRLKFKLFSKKIVIHSFDTNASLLDNQLVLNLGNTAFFSLFLNLTKNFYVLTYVTPDFVEIVIVWSELVVIVRVEAVLIRVTRLRFGKIPNVAWAFGRRRASSKLGDNVPSAHTLGELNCHQYLVQHRCFHPYDIVFIISLKWKRNLSIKHYFTNTNQALEEILQGRLI